MYMCCVHTVSSSMMQERFVIIDTKLITLNTCEKSHKRGFFLIFQKCAQAEEVQKYVRYSQEIRKNNNDLCLNFLFFL